MSNEKENTTAEVKDSGDTAQQILDAQRQNGISKKKPKKKLGKKAIIIIAVVCIIIIAAVIAAFAFSSSKDEGERQAVELTANPTIGSIRLSVTGSGTVEPYERYDIVPLVTGKILSSPYEEGDYVEEGALLYEIDHEDMDINVTKAQNALKKAQKNNETYYENLENTTLNSPATGVLSGFNLSKGDRVAENQVIATVQDTSQMIATVAFNAAQWEKISVGDTAELYLFPSMYTCTGKVTKKSYVSYSDASGALLYDVEITANNPGAVSSNTTVTATVSSSGESLKSPVSGKISFPDPIDVKAKVSGEVAQIYVYDGQEITLGQTILKIDDEDIRDSLDRALLDYSDQQLSLESTMNKMEDYNITAPISGTVITKTYKTGDTISAGGQSSNVLMVVADMSKMKFTFSADETDINKIEIGQTVEVTADAVENKIYTGEVTKIASEGISSNGVTYYDVEVVIPEPEGLRPGMNVSAEIYYHDSANVLVLPVSAVRQIRDESFVFVKGTPSVQSDKTVVTPDVQEDGETDGDMPMGKRPTGEEQSGNEAEGEHSFARMPIEIAQEAAPEGTTAVRVVTGATDGINIEIISGVTESDTVVLDQTNSPETPITGVIGQGQMMGGMQGGFGGGMPSGGMSGMSGGMSGARAGGMSGMGGMR